MCAILLMKEEISVNMNLINKLTVQTVKQMNFAINGVRYRGEEMG